jgi:regulator of cell morphogenesis and NO signaling
MKRNPTALASVVAGVLKPHHSLLRKEAARAAELSRSVVVEQKPPLCRTLLPLYRLFQEFGRELESHLDAQETSLIPRLMELAAALAIGGHGPAGDGQIEEDLRMMKYGQTLLAGVLEEMRELTHGFTAPPDACECYGELLDVLAAIQMEVDSEIRMENTLLAPEAHELLEQAHDAARSNHEAARNLAHTA